MTCINYFKKVKHECTQLVPRMRSDTVHARACVAVHPGLVDHKTQENSKVGCKKNIKHVNKNRNQNKLILGLQNHLFKGKIIYP